MVFMHSQNQWLIKGFAAIAIGMMGYSDAVWAQDAEIQFRPNPDSPIGERNPSAPAGLDQFAFVIGDWDVDVILNPPGGQKFSYKAAFHNIWIVNGQVVYQEWRGPYATGAELRTYDQETNSWTGQNYYPGPRGWWATTAEWNEKSGEMIVSSRKTDQRGEAMNREIYYDISRDRFKIRSMVSYDEGETWEAGSFSLTATRK